MRILHHDEQILKLRPTSGCGILIMGLVFFGVGLVTLFAFGTTASIICERPAANTMRCRLQASLFGLPLKDEPLEALQGARVHSYVDDDGDRMYKVVLQTGGGEMPMSNSASSSRGTHQRTVDEINDFLSDPAQPSLKLRDFAYFEKAMTFIFTLTGIGMAIWGIHAYFTSWTFDRKQGLALYRSEQVTGIKTAQYPLSDIIDVRVGTSTDSDGDDTHRVELVMSSGRRIPLTKSYSSGLRGKRKTAALIRDFLAIRSV
jgi:hypothetical protein